MMKDLMRWDPFKDILSLREEIDRIFDSFFGKRSVLGEKELTFTPVVDLEETEDSFIVEAELPGMRKEDIKITVDDDGLTLSGERKHKKEEKGKTVHRMEMTYGKFKRYIPFPKEVKPQDAKAKFENGVLSINIPKSEKAKPKEIEIEVS